MCQFGSLEVDEDKALQEVVVEHEVDIKMVALQVKMLLACHEGESTPQFQQEFLQFVDESRFQVFLVCYRILLHIKELKHVGISDKILRRF